MPTITALLADVDGTLVTKEKVLTKRAIDAVQRLRQCGIAFFITSGRPPRGMHGWICSGNNDVNLELH